MYIGYEEVAANDTAKDVADLTIPAEATHAEIQAGSNHIRYTMDDTTTADASVGMRLLTTEPPKLFLIEDLKRISFHQESAAGELLIHYVAGRDI